MSQKLQSQLKSHKGASTLDTQLADTLIKHNASIIEVIS